MRIEDLQLFLTIARTRNLHRAAEAEQLTQSALTKMLHRLEAELGVKLFERAPRGLELTDIGCSFAKRVTQMNLQLGQALQEVADMRLGELGVVRFGIGPALAESVYTPAALAFLANRPKVRYELSVQHAHVLIDQVADGRVDLVLAALPHLMPAELDHETLFMQQIHVVAREGHPLLSGHLHTRAALAGQAWLLPAHGTILRDWAERWHAEAGLAPPIVAIESDAPPSVLAGLLRRSELLAPMSLEVLGNPANHGFATLDHMVAPLEQPIALMWRRDAYLSPLVTDFRRAIEQVVRHRQRTADSYRSSDADGRGLVRSAWASVDSDTNDRIQNDTPIASPGAEETRQMHADDRPSD